MLANEVFTPANYTAVGTGTTSETISDTALETELFRKLNTNTNSKGVNCSECLIYTTDSAAEGNIREMGIFDASSSGNMTARGTVGSAVVHDDTVNTRIIKFTDLEGVNDSTTQSTQVLIDDLNTGYGSGSFTAGTHIALGTRKTFDKCDADTGWGKSADAETETANTLDYKDATASLNLGKNGTASDTFYYEKTLGSPIDVSSYTNLTLYLDFIDVQDYAKLATSDTVTIWIGNDSSNYKEIILDKADLSLGWKYYDLLLSDFTDTGSPDLSTCDFFRITFKTTNATDTITLGNILLDYISFYKAIDVDDTVMFAETFRGTLESGYPSRSGTLVTYSAEVTKAQANTYIYNYIALFNAASGGDLYFQNEFYDLQKDSNTSVTEEINFTINISDE